MTAPNWIFAPAKINLALHVVGRRDDGYHLIETMAVFADVGDRIAVEDAHEDRFQVIGSEASGLAGEDPAGNLVVRARDFLRRKPGGEPFGPVAITLDKNLPAGSGIGGGSADAAATLRALAGHFGLDVPIRDEAAVELGADVPMCLRSEPLVARGIGEDVTLLDAMPALPMVLVNPRRHVSTPDVFAVLERKENPPLPAHDRPAALDGFCGWLSEHTRNDLQEPAMRGHPVIRDCLEAFAATGPLMARMSGSGATCFGIYADATAAARAAESLAGAHPSWWIRTTQTFASTGAR